MNLAVFSESFSGISDPLSRLVSLSCQRILLSEIGMVVDACPHMCNWLLNWDVFMCG